MRIAPIVAILAALILAAPASAQSTSFRTQSWFGCKQNISCHLVTVSWTSGASGFIDGTIRSQSWFTMNAWRAGYPLRLILSPLAPGIWGPGDEYYTFGTTMQPYHDETFIVDPSSTYPWWDPVWSMMSVSYGTPAGTDGLGPLGADITLVQTPEPGSMLLLATGLGGVMAAARRRRRRTDPEA
jgi:hypothetical protein